MAHTLHDTLNSSRSLFSTVPGPGEKGQPVTWAKQERFSLRQEEVSLPLAVIKSSVLSKNLAWMQGFADHYGVRLCPHGKTTMSPTLFSQQLAAGAWGMSVATPAQAEVAAMAGATNILLANQLVGPANMAIVAKLIREQGVNFFCCVDSPRNVLALETVFAREKARLNVLIEMGVSGGRCGCRRAEEALSLAAVISQQPHLCLKGVEIYEGVIHGEEAEGNIRSFIETALGVADRLSVEGFIEGNSIVTGAGSAWFDVVCEHFSDTSNLEAIIRPGSYTVLDTGIYQIAQEKLLQRSNRKKSYASQSPLRLESALEVWAYVMSRPEPNLVIAGLGKRDVAFDSGLPTPDRAYRHGDPISIGRAQCTHMMDQHAFVEVDPDSDLQVGDILVFSTSHPCLTFDKWRAVALCDDEDNVTGWLSTFF